MRKFITVMILLIFSFTLLGCSEKNNTTAIIALVNDTEITSAQFDQYYTMIKTGYESQSGKVLDGEKDIDLIQNIKERAFEDLVLQVLVKQAAEDNNIKIAPEQVEADLQELQKRFKGDDFNKFLEQMAMTEADLKGQIELEKIFIALNEQVTADVSVTDEEVEQYYKDNIISYTEDTGMEIFHILVATEAEAQDILAKIKKGQDFSSLAKENSTCPSKAEGGNLGLVNETTSFVEEFKTAALALKAGEITKAPVKSEFGYHIIKAGKYREGKVKAFAEVKQEIAGSLEASNKNALFSSYLEGLKNKAVIEDKRK